MLTRKSISFVFGLLISFGTQSYAQNEILPLPLGKLNRDSLNAIIHEAETKQDYRTLSGIYGGIYIYYFETRFNDSATLYAIKTEEYSYKSGDSAKYYFTEMKLGELSVTAYNLSAARLYYEKALDYYLRMKNHKMLFHAYGSLANVHAMEGDSLTSVTYDALALEANKLGKDTLGEVIINFDRIKALKDQNKVNEAISLLNRNIMLINSAEVFGTGERHKRFWLDLQLNKLAECYILKNDYSSAISYLYESTGNYTTGEFSDIDMVRDRLLAKSYLYLGKTDSAIRYIDLFFERAESALQELNPERVNEISVRYESEKKQRQIEQLQQQNQLQTLEASTQKKINIAFSIIFFLLLLSSYLVVRNIQHKRKSAVAFEMQRAELEKKHLIEKERARISTELHDDMGGELSAIRLLSEMNTTNISADQQLSKISASSAELIQKMNEIVWALNVNNDSLQNLIGYIRRYTVRYLEELNTACSFRQPENIPEMQMDGATRRNIFLLVKETLHNIAKHAKATAVDVVIKTNGELQIQIHDDGNGISAEQLQCNNGNGLRNMRQRVEDLDGIMDIKNHDGTTVHFTLPYTGTNTNG